MNNFRLEPARYSLVKRLGRSELFTQLPSFIPGHLPQLFLTDLSEWVLLFVFRFAMS